VLALRAPQVLDEPIGGNDLAGAERQHGEQRPLLLAAELDPSLVGPDVE
jgi:hypothetical protein